MNITILGLSISSSWGNGHATTYRALIRALHARGHRVTFLERDVAWYRDHRDLSHCDYCQIGLYPSLSELARRFGENIRAADLVVLGSYVPEGSAIGEWITRQSAGITAFYDIDTPVTLAGLETAELDYLTPGLVPRFDVYLSFSGGPALKIVEDLYGSPGARALYCSADLDIHSGAPAAPRWSLGYLGTYSDDRQPQLEELLLAPASVQPDNNFVVAGAKYPESVAWPPNVDRIEHLPPADHAGFYGSQRFTLNITRNDMRALGFSPSVRLFEAAACGTPVISDSWPGLETIFSPCEEILLAKDRRDVLEILTEMTEERRLGIAANARQRLLRDHTPSHRARQLESYYLEALARRQPAKAKAMQHAEV